MSDLQKFIDKTTIEAARKTIADFAVKHKLVFEDKGEVGFGRPCVGLLAKSGYIDYNAFNYNTHGTEFGDVWPDDIRVEVPSAVEDAYHKHDCVAVLVHGENYGKAIMQLALWVEALEAQEVYVDTYERAAKDPINVMMHGLYGTAFRAKKEAS
mgnify:CR=1 FL=1